MPARTIVVIGGAQSGPTAASAARDTDAKARIVLLERAPEVAYAVGGLAYHLSGEVASAENLGRGDADDLRRTHRVEVRPSAEVVAIDARARRVALTDNAVEYTSLVYALGAESPIPPIDGLAGAGNVFRFRTPGDLDGILRRLEAGARRVAIVGGGFFGVEATDGFLRRGCEVTLLERGPRLLPRFTEAMAGVAHDALTRAGARVMTGAVVVAAERRGDDVHRLALRGSGSVETDLVVVTAGLRPRTDLLAKAGARLHHDGSVAIDARCATSLPGVYACGVCVALPHIVSRKPVWFAQAAQADKTAHVAGVNAAGGRATMGGVLGSAVVRAGDVTLARTGLTADEAAAFAGRRLSTVSIEAPSHDLWFPHAAPVRIDLLFDRSRGRILGAEVAAPTGADKRVDVLATAILGGVTVDRLARIDLAYAPPYSTPRDPVNVAGSAAVALRAATRRATKGRRTAGPRTKAPAKKGGAR